VGACVLRLLVVFVPRTSSTPVAMWFWQMEGRSAERVILGVRPSEFILSEFQSPSRRIFIGSHSIPPLWSPNRSCNAYDTKCMQSKRQGCLYIMLHMPCQMQEMHKGNYTYATKELSSHTPNSRNQTHTKLPPQMSESFLI
jgi:hypothetical protein